MRALKWLKGEYAAGRRTPPVKCDVCGQTEGIIEPHSEDYSDPFGDNIGQFGLCYRCHMIVHCRFRGDTAFREYARVLASGQRFQGMVTRNFPAFASQHLNANGQPKIETVDSHMPGFLALLAAGEQARLKGTGQRELL